MRDSARGRYHVWSCIIGSVILLGAGCAEDTPRTILPAAHLVAVVRGAMERSVVSWSFYGAPNGRGFAVRLNTGNGSAVDASQPLVPLGE